MNRLRAPGLTRNVLPAVGYAVCIFVAGSWPQGPETRFVFAFQDKLLHLLAFWGFEVLVWRAFAHLWPAKGRAWLVVTSVALASLIGGLLELWQALLPYRQADPWDWLADVAGALLGALGLWWSRAAAGWTGLASRAPASKR